MSPFSMFTMQSKFDSSPYFLRTIMLRVSSTIPWRRSRSMLFSRAISPKASMMSFLLSTFGFALRRAIITRLFDFVCFRSRYRNVITVRAEEISADGIDCVCPGCFFVPFCCTSSPASVTATSLPSMAVPSVRST